MSLWSRLLLLIRSLFISASERSEDSLAGLNDSYQKQQALLREANQGLIAIATACTRLEHQSSKLHARVPDLDKQARSALAGGNENLARLALQRKQAALTELAALDQHLSDMKHEEQKLTVIVLDLMGQISEFAIKREVITARYTAAQAQSDISRALSDVSREVAGLSAALTQAEERARQMEDRAAAIDDLVEHDFRHHSGARNMIERELDRIAVDDQIDNIRLELAAIQETTPQKRRQK
jgi:phage shock protein A